MNRQHSLLFPPLFVTLSLLAAFVLTTPVFAQDETPPTEPAPEETPVEEARPWGKRWLKAAWRWWMQAVKPSRWQRKRSPRAIHGSRSGRSLIISSIPPLRLNLRGTLSR